MCLQGHGNSRRVTAVNSGISLTTCILAAVLMLATVRGQETSWEKQPLDQSVIVGSRVTFPCQISTTNATISLLWNKGTDTIFLNGQKMSASVPNRYTVQGDWMLGENNLTITNVLQEDDAFYTCVAFGFDSTQVRLTVLLPPGPPEITSNTSSSTLVENSVISFTCSSRGGKPAPTILWLRNGQPLNSAHNISQPSSENGNITSSQIDLTLRHTDHSANYSCIVFNAANQNSPLITSQILNVQYSPRVHFEPQFEPYNVKVGTPAVSIRCVVDSNPRYSTMEWTKDGVPIIVLSDTKSFSSIEKSDHGNYSCRATNQVSGRQKEASAYKFVNVIYAPVITPPEPIIANISTTVNLSCKVVANPPPSEITWTKLGSDPITNNGPNFVFLAEKRHAGNYTCMAKNRLEPSEGQAADITSKGFTKVIIQYKPGRASIRPISSVIIGQRITLECSVDDPGVPSPVYEWWRKDDPSRTLQSTESPVYVIPSAVLADNGEFVCRPRNIMGMGTLDTITVEVNSPPMFINSKPSGTVYTVPITQSGVYLQHTIEGRPRPIVTWFKDGTPLSAFSNMFSVETTNSQHQLKFTVVTRVTFTGSGRDQNRLRIEDIGNFTCQVTSGAISGPVSRNIRLSIEFSPEVTTSPRVASNIGEMAILKCAARANPPPTYHWYRFGQLLSNSSQKTLGQMEAAGIAAYEGFLQIHSVDLADFGEYECEATNSKGQAKKALMLSQKDKPEAPTNLIAIEKTWESVRLQWSPGFNGGYTQSFFVAYQSIHGNKTQEVYPQGLDFFNVTRLMPQTSYTFHVYGKNQLGSGANSVGFTAQTKVLVFPALNSVPEFHVEDKRISVPNDLDQSYCLRIEISTDNRRVWTVVEPCVTAENGKISLDRPGATDVNVSICLVYRPEVCGEPVASKINEATTPDLTKSQVIIIGCVCAAILTVLLIILVCIVWRRRQRNKNYANDPHSPRTVQQGNGVIPNQKPRTYDNQDGVISNAHNGFPVQYLSPADNYPMGDTSYDSHTYDKQYEYEMNRRNANNGGDHQYYSEKQGDLSFSGSPRTPTKDSGQFISVPEDHAKEGGGSFGSGNESGYSTPDKAKPKKAWTLKPSFFQGNTLFPFSHSSNKGKNIKMNPDIVPYSHDPPGHTCGLPCCSEDLQIQLRKQQKTRSCIGIQDCEVIQQNFMFKGHLKRQPTLESGFFSVQDSKECPHAPIPKFGSLRGAGLSTISEEKKSYPFLKGREITLPESSDPNATEKLYLEDFSLGESDDFLDLDSGSTPSEIEYYMSYKHPLDPEKGVPYSPKDVESRQIYPWDLLRDVKDNISTKAFSDKAEDSASSNYYEILQFADENYQSDLLQLNQNPVAIEDKPKQPPGAPEPPPLPPKLPAQNRFNHPPLPKTENLHPDHHIPPNDDNKTEMDSTKHSTNDSGLVLTKYNMYNSCSLTNMANQASKEALEKYRSLDRSINGQNTTRTDVRDFDFTGASTYTVTENMQITRHEQSNILQKTITADGTDKPSTQTEEEQMHSGDSAYCSGEKLTNFTKSKIKMETDEMKVKLLDDDYEDDDEEIRGIINPSFKNVNVDGKFLGSRYSVHSLDRLDDDNEELQEWFQHLSDLDTCDMRNEDDVLILLKERLQEFDCDETTVHYGDDLPVTLIL